MELPARRALAVGLSLLICVLWMVFVSVTSNQSYVLNGVGQALACVLALPFSIWLGGRAPTWQRGMRVLVVIGLAFWIGTQILQRVPEDPAWNPALGALRLGFALTLYLVLPVVATAAADVFLREKYPPTAKRQQGEHHRIDLG